MNLSSIGIALWEVAGGLAIEVFFIVGIAALADRLAGSVSWRRAVWQICFLSLTVLGLSEFTGVSRRIGLSVAASDSLDSLAVAKNRATDSRSESGTILLLPRAPSMGEPLAEESREPARELQTAQTVTHTQTPVDSGSDRASTSSHRRNLDPNRTRESHGGDEKNPTPSTAPSIENLTRALQDPANGSLPSPSEQSVDVGSEPPRITSSPIGLDHSVRGWIVMIWLLGVSLALLRVGVSHFLFLALLRRSAGCEVQSVQPLILEIAGKLGIRRRVRFIQTRGLASPIAFGIFRPTVGLPSDFPTRFNSDQQSAVLAHELAHLAACDPLWRLVTDLATAAFWWHPVVWLARNHAHTICEMAADEASALTKDGSSALAESLIALGSRLAGKQPRGLIGVTGRGYQSNLGRRVERLLSGRNRTWHPPERRHTRIAATFASVILVPAAIVTAAWSHPESFNKGDTTMNTIKQAWKKSIATLTVASAFIGTNNPAQTNLKPDISSRPKPPTESIPEDVSDAAASSQPVVKEETHPGYDPMDRKLLERYGLLPYGIPPSRTTGNQAGTPNRDRYGLGTAKTEPGSRYWSGNTQSENRSVEAKLERIVLDEVFYDGVPLPEVLRDLSKEAQIRDPEKRGVNFLIGNSSAPDTTMIDPTTGHAVTAPPMSMNDVLVRFNLPLRNIRLKDALDAITKVTDAPVHYSLAPYGVVFALGAPSADGTSSNGPTQNSPGSGFYMMDPKLMERYGLTPPTKQSNFVTQPRVSKSANATKLDSIVLEEISFSQIPLKEAVEHLSEKSRQLDSERKGINFLISNSSHPAGTPVIDPITGGPLPLDSVDLRDVPVSFNLPLRNVSLRDVLDAITKVVEQPVTYTVEDYGVIFSFASDATPNPFQMASPFVSSASPAEVRTFRVEKAKLVSGLHAAFGIEVVPSLIGQPINTVRAPKSLPDALRQVFTVLGVTFPAPDKSVYYNELTGILMVRAAVEDLKTIQAVIETLGGGDSRSPQQPKEPKSLNPFGSLNGNGETMDFKQPATEATNPLDTRRKSFVEPVQDSMTASVLGTVPQPGVPLQKSNTVVVLGAVRQPGSFPIPEGHEWTIPEAIAHAGGFSQIANKKKIELTRNGKMERFRFDDLRGNNGASLDQPSDDADSGRRERPKIQAGDVIYVQESMF